MIFPALLICRPVVLHVSEELIHFVALVQGEARGNSCPLGLNVCVSWLETPSRQAAETIFVFPRMGPLV